MGENAIESSMPVDSTDSYAVVMQYRDIGTFFKLSCINPFVILRSTVIITQKKLIGIH